MSTGTLDLIRNGRMQTDLDAATHRILNLNTDNLAFGQFGAQAPHSVYAGPDSGVDDAIPSFRLMTADEFGAQPQDDALDTLSGTTPSSAGIGLLEISDPAFAGYTYNNGADAGSWIVQTPTQVRTTISAQPLHANLTTLAGLTFTTTAFLTTTLPISTASYTKLNTNGTVSLLTAAEVATDIGATLAPFIDSTPIIKGSADPFKLFKIELDGWATGVTRIMSPPDYNFTPASIDHQEDLVNKNINGLTLAVGTAPDKDTAPDYDDTPSQPFYFRLVAIGSSANMVLRCPAPVDLVMPIVAGETLTTVETTIPLSYLSIKTDLNDGGGASNSKVSSQLAVKTYVDDALIHIGGALGTGQGDEVAVFGADTSVLEPGYAYSQWYQVYNISSTGSGEYNYDIVISEKNVQIGSFFRIRLEFQASGDPQVNIYDKTIGGALLQTVSGQSDADTTYVFEAVWNGISWKKYDGRYAL